MSELKEKLRILLIDDNRQDRIAFCRACSKSNVPFSILEAEKGEEGLEKLLANPGDFDLVVIDYKLPGISGLDVLTSIIEHGVFIAKVLLTGCGSEELAVQALKLGVDDYIVKDPSQGYLTLLPAVLPEVVNRYEDRKMRIIAEKALRKSEERFRAIADYTYDWESWFGTDGKLLWVNPTVFRATGYTPRECLKMDDFPLSLINEEDREMVAALFSGAIRDKTTGADVRFRIIHKNGSMRWLEISWQPICGKSQKYIGVRSSIRDISNRVRKEQEREKLEQALGQSQKLEAVGRLAGGVAHDFNNLLTAIQGYTELIDQSLAEDDPLRQDLDEIRQASERAASLTQQLLAFSRKQVIRPRPINLNDLLAKSRNIFGRIIGEDITLELIHGNDLWTVRADPHQIDQILVNLAMNAREAMPNGGRLTIRTENLDLGEEESADIPESQPGGFVKLSVGDTGVGIEKDDLEHIFEPFFSTKPVGKGPGLGLSTVYGIIKQNHGFAQVETYSGIGTTFHLFFPALDSSIDPEPLTPGISTPKGTETILLVEDEEIVRVLAKRILEKHGYKVIEADSGGQAYLLFKENKDRISLLITDVIMPRMNGRELFEQLAILQPHLKVLFVSGYSEKVFTEEEIGGKSMNFLSKPFSIDELALKVRKVLDKS